MKYFSTFTGIGGLDIGLEELGFKCVGFSEIKESSIRIYNSHYLNYKNFGDITKLDYSTIPDFDILAGGFPCQSFSMAGMRKGFEDKKGVMIFYLYDLMMAKKPEYVVLENVKGLLTHNKGMTFLNVMQLLGSAGYKVRVLLLNAINYGSAQNRERLIFLCSRHDFEKKIPEIIDNKKLFRDFRDDNKDNFVFVKETERNLKRFNREHVYSFELIGGYDKVGTILTTRYGDTRRSKVIQEKDGKFRYLTLLEAERLQGFPDNFTEIENVTNRWFAIGNAVNCNVSRYLFKNYLKGLWY
jgi:DNA (cytosine-5)-methyltransferase 1